MFTSLLSGTLGTLLICNQRACGKQPRLSVRAEAARIVNGAEAQIDNSDDLGTAQEQARVLERSGSKEYVLAEEHMHLENSVVQEATELLRQSSVDTQNRPVMDT